MLKLHYGTVQYNIMLNINLKNYKVVQNCENMNNMFL